MAFWRSPADCSRDLESPRRQIEAQLTSERAASLAQTAAALESHLTSEQQARAAEQVRHAAERDADAARLAQMEEAQQQLLGELAASMDMQEADVREAERLRALLAEREAMLAEREAANAALAAQAEALMAAEARALERAAADAAQLEDARSQLAQADTRLRAAQGIALRTIGAAARLWRQRRDVSKENPAPATHEAAIATRPIGDFDWAPEGEEAVDEVTDEVQDADREVAVEA